ncbi:MAG: hypothetical protein AUK44_02700 [Porphyromonadaceae bacterium CG2_30_38_12]|nr:MAG: hypothetical protein AUK44_02700 [Porphyromonadaceae bacterium CG2_30_38_12]
MNTSRKLFFVSVQLIFSFSVFSQNLVWTGSAGDNAFFNETNWKNTATNTAPTAGTIDLGVAINANLTIENASAIVGGTSGISTDILMGTGNLSIRKSTLKMASGKGIDMGGELNTLTIDSAVVTADYLKNATSTLSGDSKLYLINTNPFDAATNINITSNDAWIFASNLNPATAITTHIPRVKINGSALVDLTNSRISQYYYGSAIAAYSSSMTPLRIYDNLNLSGTFTDIIVRTIWSGNSIPSGFNNKAVSFKLKKGYMATLAVNDDGTGMSKVYIASESDLIVNTLPSALSGKISFIRVLPWVWTNKKGFGKQNTDADFSSKINTKGLWFYDWGLGRNSTIDLNYAPLSWGKNSLDTPTKRNTVVNKSRVTHIMSFNEADDCTAQSGQYGSLCDHDTAALWHKHAMKLGMRIVSPSGREGTETTWLKLVNTIMVPEGTRMDVIGMHWYDWGGLNSASDANSIFTRFKNKVIACYNYYKMPIWITEFNANKNRLRATQDAFLQLALPWLEATPYVERYAYFQPDGGNGSFVDTSGNLTTTGNIYLNQVSTPSIPQEYVNSYVNNLQSRMSEVTTVHNVIVDKERLEYQFNAANKHLVVNSATLDSVNLLDLQGMILKQITPNTLIVLSGVPAGIYILAANGFHTEKILIY